MPQVQTIAQHFVKSGFFKDTRDLSQAVVRIMAGAEMGFGPFASMQGVYIIEGKPTIAAGLMASAVKRSGRYNYRVREHTDTACAIEFFEGKEGVGVSRFTLENAQAAGLTGKGPWKAYPKNMLFARAKSNGVKWFCPDVFAGPVYTPEELGREVDEDGALVVTAEAAPVIRMVDPATAEVVMPAAEPAPVERTVLDLKAALEWLQTLPAPDAYTRSQRTHLGRLLMRVADEAREIGCDLPERQRDVTDAAWAAVAIMALAEFRPF